MPWDPLPFTYRASVLKSQVAEGEWSHFTAGTNPLVSSGPFRSPCCPFVSAFSVPHAVPGT